MNLSASGHFSPILPFIPVSGRGTNFMTDMSGYKADHQQVVKMSRIHTNKVIAKRLGISTRQVSRILAKYDASKQDPEKRGSRLDRETENAVMEFSRITFGESYAEIGRRHGLTRQAVQQRLTNN